MDFAHLTAETDRCKGRIIEPVAELLNVRHGMERHWAAVIDMIIKTPGITDHILALLAESVGRSPTTEKEKGEQDEEGLAATRKLIKEKH